jgi:hypothetical protein
MQSGTVPDYIEGKALMKDSEGTPGGRVVQFVTNDTVCPKRALVIADTALASAHVLLSLCCGMWEHNRNYSVDLLLLNKALPLCPTWLLGLL